MPVTVAVPWDVPVRIVEQLAVPPLPLSVQLAGDTLPPLAVKLTLPVGVVAVPAAVSLTVAVQLPVPLKAIGVTHDTVVDVVRLLTVMDPLPELVVCVASPA